MNVSLRLPFFTSSWKSCTAKPRPPTCSFSKVNSAMAFPWRISSASVFTRTDISATVATAFESGFDIFGASFGSAADASMICAPAGDADGDADGEALGNADPSGDAEASGDGVGVGVGVGVGEGVACAFEFGAFAPEAAGEGEASFSSVTLKRNVHENP